MKKLQAIENFINKLWNIARFIIEYNGLFSELDENELISMQNPKFSGSKDELNLADSWILNKTNNIIEKVTEKLDTYRIGEAGEILYDFVWRDFADWYIEIFKNKEYECKPWVLRYVFINVLKLLHPFTPFISEYLWGSIFDDSKYNLLISSDWPVPSGKLNKKVINNFESIQKYYFINKKYKK